MIRSPAFIREEEEVDVVSQNIVASSQASSTMVMVAGLPQSQSWHSLSSFTLPSRSKTKKEQRHHEQQTSHNRTPSASSSRSNSGKSSGYSSTISTPGHYLNVRPAMSKSNGSSPVASASAHACRRCGNLLCKWRKTHHNVVVCGAGGVGKSALLVQYLTHRFIYDYDPTLEESYHSFLALDGSCAELDITELAGQNMTEATGLFRSQMRNADGFIVVYDITDPSTLAEAERTIDIIQRNILTSSSASESDNSNRSSMSDSVRNSLIVQHGRHGSDDAIESSLTSPRPLSRKSDDEQKLSATPTLAVSPTTPPYSMARLADRTDSSTPIVASQHCQAGHCLSPSPSATNCTVKSPTSPTTVIPRVQVEYHRSNSRDSLDIIGDSEFPPIILVGNKCDLESERKVSTRDARQVSLETGCFFDEASARSGHDDVDRVMAMLVHLMRHPQALNDGTFSPAASPRSRPSTPSNLLSDLEIGRSTGHLGHQRFSSLSAATSVSFDRQNSEQSHAKRRRSCPNVHSTLLVPTSSGWDGKNADPRSATLSPGGTRPGKHQWWLRASLREHLVRFQAKLKSRKSRR